MKAIGFTNKFYTLWEVWEDEIPLGNGRKYVITHHDYIKNISFNRETAMKKYPGVEINESLHGQTRSWESKKEVWDNVDTFRFGKYVNQKIEEVNDFEYLEWYWKQIYTDHKEFVLEYLKKNGYEIRFNSWINHDGYQMKDYYLMSPTAIENEKKAKDKYQKLIEEVKNSKELTFFCEYNPDEEGEYWDNNIHYHFQEVKENYYNGFNYYLPVLNGKSKRVKNKNIKVTEFTYKIEKDYIQIEILNFEIIK